MSALWSQGTLRELRQAVVRRNPKAFRFVRVRQVLLKIPRQLWRTVIVAFWFVLGVLMALGGGLVNGKGEALHAASGFFAAKWTLCALLFAHFLKAGARERPPVPEILLLVPAGADLLGRRARRFAIREVLRIIAASVAVTLLVTCIAAMSRVEQGRPLHWWLLPPAALALWMHLAALTSCVPSLWRIAARWSAKLTRWQSLSLVLLLVAAIIVLIGAPFGLAENSAHWLVPAGNVMAAIFPAASLLSWPVTHAVPYWPLTATVVLLVCGFGNLRRYLNDLRQIPEIPGCMEDYWDYREEDEDSWEEEEEETPETGTPDEPEIITSPGVPAPAGPAMLQGLSAGLRGFLAAPQCQEGYFLGNPYGKVRAAVPDIKGLLWIFILFAGAVACGIPLIYGAAWIFVVVCGSNFSPGNLHLQHPYCFQTQYITGQPGRVWLPLPVKPAWQSTASRYNEAIRSTVYPALLLAGIGAVLSLLLRPLKILLRIFAETLGAKDEMPETWGFAAACAMAILAVSIARRAWGPGPFGKDLIPRSLLTFGWRLIHRLSTAAAGMASIFAVFGILTIGSGILKSGTTTEFFATLRPAAIFLVLSELLRLASIHLAFFIWGQGQRK